MTGRASPTDRAGRAVATIAVAQLLGTSLWFSVNAAAFDLAREWRAGAGDIGLLTNATQLGFIVGTLAISLSGFADRHAASRIFVAAACLGALANATFAFGSHGLASGLPLRFAVGLCLAGIYPLGMKLIVGWAPERAAQSLALLVAMLTLGTALPHALRLVGADWPWRAVVGASSLLAVVGAALVGRLGDGPAPATPPAPDRDGRSFGAVLGAFRSPAFRASAFGYFGHMWELYAFWTLVPLLVVQVGLDGGPWGVAGASFAIVAAGAVGCVLGGVASRRFGGARVAAVALAASGLCGAVFALFAARLPPAALLVLMLAWGLSVIADSPQFSALSAQACPPHLVGSALALQNAVGFAITVVSIALVSALVDSLGTRVAWLLVPGPVLGVAALSRSRPAAARGRPSGRA